MPEFSLKDIIRNFRVQDLQLVCTYAGLSKSGRKSELVNRALEIIKNPSEELETKIRFLHKLKFPQTYNRPEQAPADSSSQDNPTSAAMQSRNTIQHYPRHFRSRENTPNYSSTVILPSNRVVSSQPTTHLKEKQSERGNPVNPDVKFKPIPFYDVIDQLSRPIALAPQDSNHYQDAYFMFQLSPTHIQKMKDSQIQSSSNLSTTHHSVQVQMRLGLLETNCEQDDNYPPFITVRVNNKLVDLPPMLPQSKAGQTPRRTSKPLNITKECRTAPSFPNHVQIQWTTEFGKRWAVAVFLVSQNEPDELLKRLRNRGLRSAQHTKSLVKEKLRIDSDSDISTTSLKLSLCCPLGKMKMQTPVRSTQCSHVHCFDANMYIRMNEKRPNWNCPVCEKKAYFQDLLIDEFFLNILEGSSSDCTEIYVFEDANWEPIDGEKLNNPPRPLSPPPPQLTNNTSIVVVESTSEPPPIKIPKKGRKKKESSSPIPNIMPNPLPQPVTVPVVQSVNLYDELSPEASSSPPEIIDLTSDTDEESNQAISSATDVRSAPCSVSPPALSYYGNKTQNSRDMCSPLIPPPFTDEQFNGESMSYLYHDNNLDDNSTDKTSPRPPFLNPPTVQYPSFNHNMFYSQQMGGNSKHSLQFIPPLPSPPLSLHAQNYPTIVDVMSNPGRAGIFDQWEQPYFRPTFSSTPQPYENSRDSISNSRRHGIVSKINLH